MLGLTPEVDVNVLVRALVRLTNGVDPRVCGKMTPVFVPLLSAIFRVAVKAADWENYALYESEV
jgi:hypothetical protein